MPNEHLPGARAQLKATAMATLAARDPDCLLYGPTARPNITAIAQRLGSSAPNLHKMVKGQAPLNLEVLAAHVAARGCWCAADELAEIVDEHGSPVELRHCNCAEREPVAA